MLKIQEYILSHSDWREALAAAPFNLKIEEKGPYVLFKYNQLNSDFNEEICREARGIILKKPDFKVVRKAFNKFFNFGENFADDIDWSSATSTEKMDGSLISFWFDEGEWHISTNGTLDAHDAELNSAGIRTFYDLVEATMRANNYSTDNFNPNYCYTMELCTQFNQIVLSYSGLNLYHILTVDMRTLEEVEDDVGIPKPAQYNLASQSDYEKLVSTFDESHEGIVIKDKFNHRVKMKTQLYFQLHKMINNGNITYERALDLILANEDGEFLVYFPQYRDFFGIVRTDYINAQRVVNWIDYYVQQWKKEDENPTLPFINPKSKGRKGFAQWVKLYYSKWSSVCFLAYEGRLQERREQLKTAKEVMKFYHIGDKK